MIYVSYGLRMCTVKGECFTEYWGHQMENRLLILSAQRS